MRLDQLHEMKLWHQRHCDEYPVEKQVWDVVLTLWIASLAGIPAALLIHAGWAVAVCATLIFLPRAYVSLRRRLHSARLVRCDWIVALGR